MKTKYHSLTCLLLPIQFIQASYLLHLSVIILPVIANPVHSGILFATLISNINLFPVVVYNTTGQVVANISNPKVKLYLPCGVYFLKLANIEKTCAKIVVVK
jgi:hypothetical protein